MKGISTYLGAAPIVECLEKYHPNVIITSRVADAALFLAPMVGNDFCMMSAQTFRSDSYLCSFFQYNFVTLRSNAVFLTRIASTLEKFLSASPLGKREI